MGKLWAYILIATCLGSAVVLAEDDANALPPLEIVISVAEQKLAVVQNGELLRKYPISTSKFGLGDAYNSFKTPLGHLRVCDKIGAGLTPGSVLKSRNATGEILPANAPGRDPIVTRILWLEGLESCNAAAKSRGIYIHGTVEESKLGQPVSYGCIRMRSRDVMELFDDTPVGTPVEILADRFPHFQRAQPKTELFASNDSITTVMGPHGMVIVKTVRPGEPPSVAKDKVASALTLFADAKSPAPAVPQSLPEKPSEPAAKPLAKTTAPPPIAVGPTVVLRPPPPAEPRVVLYAMNGSILDSDMPKSAKPAVPAPVAAKPVSPPEAQVAAVPRESQVPATEPDAPRNLVLQVTEPIDLLASPKEAASQAPLDQLSTHLLNPPAPPFRLAFRTAAATPDL